MTMLVIPARAKAEILPPMSFRSEARNLLIPARAKVVNPPPAVISKRSEKSSFPTQPLSPKKPTQTPNHQEIQLSSPQPKQDTIS